MQNVQVHIIELTMNNGFYSLNNDEMENVNGGVNWDRIIAGAGLYTGATMALFALGGPVGIGVAVSYWGVCAVSGTAIGYGIIS